MKRPWYCLALLMFLCAFSFNTGMIITFIPLFFCLFLVLPERRLMILLPLLLLRVFWISPMESGELQGEFLLEPLSPASKEACIHFQGQKFYLRSTTLEAGSYQGKLFFTEFSQKRSPSGFSERDYYFSKGYRGEGRIIEAHLFHKKSFPLHEIRKKLFQRAEVFGEFQGVVYSLLFGIKDALDPKEKELFAQLGLLHLFVVSGLHLGVYRRFILRVVFLLKGPRLVGDLLSLSFLFFLCMISGFHVSTLRSLGIYALGALGFYRKEKMDPLESLACVSFFLLLFRPSFATSYSFLLGSFAYGILRISRKRSLFWMYLLMLPFQLQFLHHVKITSYLVNGFLALIMGVFLPILSLGMILPILSQPSVMMLRGMMAILHGIEKIPLAFSIAPMGFVSMILFYTAILIRELMREKEGFFDWAHRKETLLIFLVLLSSLHFIEGKERREGIHFFDVGQGDSSLIVTEKGKTILIDTGKGRKIHDLLHGLGIEEIDVLIISHLDEDHSGEVEKIRYKKLYLPVGSAYTEGIPLKEGDRLELDHVILRVLSPRQARGESNDDSLVFFLEAYGHKILYTGDVSHRILKNLEAETSTLVKFPHHGSKDSLCESFMDQVSPQILFLSFGRNRYGHPHDEVLDYGKSRGYIIFQTMNDGNLLLKRRGFRSY